MIFDLEEQFFIEIVSNDRHASSTRAARLEDLDSSGQSRFGNRRSDYETVENRKPRSFRSRNSRSFGTANVDLARCWIVERVYTFGCCGHQSVTMIS